MSFIEFLKQILQLIIKEMDHVLQLPIKHHLIIGLCIRLLLIIYGGYHDTLTNVKYTDVDYRVFTDAAHRVLMGESPYDRHTYRYSPIIAWLLLPNVLLHESFGKVLFSIFDILITICINSFILQKLDGKVNAAKVAKYCSLFWLYNPFSIAISTRGNADSLSCLLVLLSIYFLQGDKLQLGGNGQYFLSGIFLGVSIHLRLYPILFSLPMYLSLGDCNINRSTPFRTALISLIIPNSKQVTLAVTTFGYFVTCTYGMYLIYGYKFIYETYIYHLFRKDTRHNFSLFFYHSYLKMGDTSFDLISFTSQVFVAILQIFLSIAFGRNPVTLPFALFCQSTVLVIYNSVITSQYFLWFLSLLPLIVQDIKTTVLDGTLFVLLWTVSQCSWLLFAYYLEFINQETFILIWIAGVFLFYSAIAVLYQLILLYTPGYGFGIARTNIAAKDE